MVRLRNIGSGWSRDLPDARDLRLDSDVVERLLGSLPPRRGARQNRVAQIDWSEYFPDMVWERDAPAGSAELAPAQACAALAQYFQRRATGELLEPSALFLHQVAQRLRGHSLDEPGELRATLKALARFGLPPARLWKPGKNSVFPHLIDPMMFGYARPWSELRYVRLDAPEATGALVLRTVKAFLAAGFVAVFGSVLPDVLNDDGQIAFPTRHELATTPQALLALGYDDQHRWRSQKGALRVRGFFDQQWGKSQGGWLPYRYVEERLAVDFWTLLRPDWLQSGEFTLPAGV